MIRAIWLILRKDLTVEVRSREIAYTTLFFAVSCVLVFAFALVREGKPPEDGAAGILWIAIAFAGTLALGRTFERERQSETLRHSDFACRAVAPRGRSLFRHSTFVLRHSSLCCGRARSIRKTGR